MDVKFGQLVVCHEFGPALRESVLGERESVKEALINAGPIEDGSDGMR